MPFTLTDQHNAENTKKAIISSTLRLRVRYLSELKSRLIKEIEAEKKAQLKPFMQQALLRKIKQQIDEGLLKAQKIEISQKEKAKILDAIKKGTFRFKDTPEKDAILHALEHHPELYLKLKLLLNRLDYQIGAYRQEISNNPPEQTATPDSKSVQTYPIEATLVICQASMEEFLEEIKRLPPAQSKEDEDLINEAQAYYHRYRDDLIYLQEKLKDNPSFVKTDEGIKELIARFEALVDQLNKNKSLKLAKKARRIDEKCRMLLKNFSRIVSAYSDESPPSHAVHNGLFSHQSSHHNALKAELQRMVQKIDAQDKPLEP